MTQAVNDQLVNDAIFCLRVMPGGADNVTSLIEIATLGKNDSEVGPAITRSRPVCALTRATSWSRTKLAGDHIVKATKIAPMSPAKLSPPHNATDIGHERPD